ncbi:putative chemotaxis protein, MotB-like protein [Sulfurimonas gotlandica GD1]|uniref:Putative chemotaxis protein, MotB-like protein n=1 Tax=Sulfurimonas gotlandica (strain DSM 19862 / JCM 16533 / GD1) TaxID=929558 RepID=B6BJS4_SULGG|nr:OmpA family protein [Sulfurimonas gotlandica]EDZ62649.1 putative membrane protein [Sulfurimonas gotlandica GD1]EHP31323.1 putative chemotaxis protein, MotB-like protein [Sulfurimonas gotlandica GD1]
MLKQDKNESQNFWISYADLMAGLLFVFILVVGAIVVKTLLMQSDLQTIRLNLEKEKSALELSESQLFEKKKKLRELVSKLQASREENMRLSMQISMLKSETDELKNEVSILNLDIKTKASKLTLSEKEMQLLKELLLENEEDANMLRYKIDILHKEVEGTKTEITQLQSFVQSANARHELDSSFIKIRDEEIAQLEKALLLKSRDYQRVIEDLNITKIKIKNLTGIKISVVQRLKKKLGNSIEIDPQTGALRFSSNILFTQGEAELKPSAKKELSRILGKYIDVLLNDPKMRRYVDLITIEGHTNSDGSYLFNLDLSQRRALAVMEFLYTQYPNNRELFKKYLSASGRSFAEPILDANKKEDKDASRRIEIKFRIKSEDAVKELMNYLNKKEN